MRIVWVLRVAAFVFVCCSCTEIRNQSMRDSPSSRAGAGGRDDAADGGPTPEVDAGDLPVGRAGAGGAGAGAGAGSVAGSGSGSGGSAAGGGGVGGDGGAAGAAGGGMVEMTERPGPVRGTLIDALRRPLKNVEVHIGEHTATTDDVGKFTIDDVGPNYHVAFALSGPAGSGEGTAAYSWRFEGLTRRDPTLQVYPVAETQLASLVWHTRGTTFPIAENQRIWAGFGSPDGDFAAGVNTADYDSPIVYWSGPETTVGATHGIMLTVSGDDELPLEYLAHDVKPLSLTVGADAEASFDFSKGKLPMGSVTGRVTARGQGARSNWLVLRWSDGTAFSIGEDYSGTDAFSYFVPTIENASSAVVALQGRNGEFPLSIAFADNLSAGMTGVQIDLPLPAAPVAPGDTQSNVDGSTVFQWSGDAKVFVFVAEIVGGDAMYVVTSAKQAKLPVVPEAPYTPPAASVFRWHVETHGNLASVDDAAGSDGLLSAFFDGRLHGPKRGSGSFTASAARRFTTAP